MEEHQIIAYINNELSSSQETEFENWLHASEKNKREFEKYKFIWEESSVKLDNEMPDKEKMWAAINPEKKPGVIGSLFSGIKTIHKIAATILILVSVGSILYKTLAIFDVDTQLIFSQTQETKKEIVLPDGSVVWLNASSKLTYPKRFSRKQRDAELHG